MTNSTLYELSSCGPPTLYCKAAPVTLYVRSCFRIKVLLDIVLKAKEIKSTAGVFMSSDGSHSVVADTSAVLHERPGRKPCY